MRKFKKEKIYLKKSKIKKVKSRQLSLKLLMIYLDSAKIMRKFSKRKSNKLMKYLQEVKVLLNLMLS